MSPKLNMSRRPALRIPRRDDDGQLVTAVMIGVMLIGLMITFQVLLPIGQATDQKAGARTAADAAALGAATEMSQGLPGAVVGAAGALTGVAGLPALLNSIGCGNGAAAALDYAKRNGADLTSYDCNLREGTVDVTVRGDEASLRTSGHALADARARFGPALGPCNARRDPADPANPAPGGPGGPAEPDPGSPATPAGVGWILTCGALELHFTVLPGSPIPVLDTTPGQIRQQLLAAFGDKPILLA
jgi:hypothetical protein